MLRHFIYEYTNIFIAGKNKKIFSCLRPVDVQKNNPGDAPETKLIFFWPYGHFDQNFGHLQEDREFMQWIMSKLNMRLPRFKERMDQWK